MCPVQPLKESQGGLALVGRVHRPGRLRLVEVTHENVTVFLMGDCGVRQGSAWKVEATQGI